MLALLAATFVQARLCERHAGDAVAVHAHADQPVSLCRGSTGLFRLQSLRKTAPSRLAPFICPPAVAATATNMTGHAVTVARPANPPHPLARVPGTRAPPAVHLV